MTETFSLANGIKCVYVKREGIKSVGMVISIKSGSAYENENNNGIAHLLEHLSFNAIPGYNKRELSDTFMSLGASTNAHTSSEVTSYEAWFPEDSLDSVAQLMADVVWHSSFNHSDIENEKSIIINEIRQIQDEPQSLLFEELEENIYRDQSYGMPIAGTEETLSKIDQKGLISWRKKMYKPESMYIGLCGGLDSSIVFSTVDKYFSRVASSGKGIDLVTPAFHEGTKTIVKGLQQSYVALAIESFHSLHKNRFPANALAFILGGSQSSRLWMKLREELGIAYHTGAFHPDSPTQGILTMFAIIDPSKSEQCREIMLDELSKVAKDGLNKGELARIKNFVKTGLMKELEKTLTTAQVGSVHYLASGKPLDPMSQIDELNKVTEQDVIDLAQHFCSSKKFTLEIR